MRDHQSQSAASALLAVFALLEWLEQHGELLCSDADTAVDHIQHELTRVVAWRQLKAQLDAADVGELECVSQQVVDDLAQSFRIDGDNGAGLGEAVEAKRQPALPSLGTNCIQRLAAESCNVARFYVRLEGAAGQA